MLHGIEELRGFSVDATDGTIGRVRDFYFDDQFWAVRFIVVETGAWLNGRRVLISPIAIGKPDWHARRLPVALSRDLVKRSPQVDTRRPVSRQDEIEQFAYYGYPNYWGGPAVWGHGMLPGAMRQGAGAAEPEAFVVAPRQLQHQRGDDTHLRGCDAIMRYDVQAIDGNIGHVDGLVVDDQTWLIRYLVVDTSDWWLGHDVLIAPQWIDDISWLQATVSVGLSRRAVRDAPLYDRGAAPDREHERRLYGHHGRLAYWVDSRRHEAQARRA